MSNSRGDIGSSTSASVEIAALAMQAQREANRLTQQKLELDRGTLELAGKQTHTQRIAATAAVIAAIASIANLMFSIFIGHNESKKESYSKTTNIPVKTETQVVVPTHTLPNSPSEQIKDKP